MFRTFLFLPLLIGALGSPLLAQSGGLKVQVLDGSNREPLVGATVLLKNQFGLVAPSVESTDREGWAEFPVLRVGSGYVVEISMNGFSPQRQEGMRVGTGETTTLRLALSQEIREQVQVLATSDVVDLEQTERVTRFDDDFIDNLPNPGRFYQNLLTLAPGVKDSDGDGNPNVHGGRSRDFRAEVGGVSNTDPLTGEWLSFVNSDSIEELQIITAGAGVEFGRASAGFARIVQKQGNNEFEGVLNMIYRSSVLDGEGTTSNNVTETPDFEWIQPSLQISGPLIRDKLWYRLSHEYLKREDPIVFSDRINVTQRRQTTNSDQITWQPSPRNKFTFQFQSDPQTVDNFGLSSRVAPESSQTLDRGGPTYSLTWVAPLSPRLLFDTVVAYQNQKRNLTPTSTASGNGCVEFGLFGSPFGGLNEAGCFNTETGFTSGSYPESSRDRRQRLTVRTQTTLYRSSFLGMSHRVKVGFEVENERYFRDLERKPDITFFTDVFDLGTASIRVAIPPVSSARATGTNWALYVEDQLRPADSLSITLGLRLDREEINSQGQSFFDPRVEAQEFDARVASGVSPSNAAGRSFTAFAGIGGFDDAIAQAIGVFPGTISLGPTALSSTGWQKTRRAEDIVIRRNNLAPRISLAWDPWRNGKTKFSASAGRYYNKIVLGVPLLELEPPDAVLTFTAVPFNGTYRELGRPGGISPSVSVKMVDRNLRTPYQDELAFSFERVLWPESSIKLTYLKRHFRDQLQDQDINHLTGDLGRCVEAPFLGQPVVVPSEPVIPGLAPVVTDPYTGEMYVDNTPGPGDGRIDDCTGNLRTRDPVPPPGTQFEIPDGLSDLYVQNPGWGEILFVGNFNETEYESFVFEFVRRMYRGWQMNLSYTWSEAIGNAEDFTQVLGNERNLLEDERGFLAFDQRHVASLSAITVTRWGIRLGGSLRWESGLPYSTLVSKQTLFSVPPQYQNIGDKDLKLRFRYPSRQRNDQRNPSFWSFDLRAAKEFDLGRGVGMQLTAEIFNLLDDETARTVDRIDGTNSIERRFGRRFQVGARVSF